VLKTYNFSIRIKVFGINFKYLSMNIFIGSIWFESYHIFFNAMQKRPNIPVFQLLAKRTNLNLWCLRVFVAKLLISSEIRKSSYERSFVWRKVN